MKVTLGPSSLLLHDGDDPDNRRVFRPFDLWDSTPSLDVLLVPNGGGSGAVVAGDWLEQHKVGTIAGRAQTGDRASFEAFRRDLLAACPPGVEVELRVEDDLAVVRRMFVLRSDEVRVEWFKSLWATYELPLVAPDPGKYAVLPLSGAASAWSGADLYRTYDPVVRRYDLVGGKWVRTYTLVVPSTPQDVTLISDGDQTSERVTVTVTGPVTQGQWSVIEESSGDVITVDLSVPAGQTLVLDSNTRSAVLSGTDVTHLVDGDWPRLPPGTSVWRLATAFDSTGTINVSALPRYT